VLVAEFDALILQQFGELTATTLVQVPAMT